ncbi:MAG TPA: ABC-F family ATP-binding cassette domain-containing protein [Gemmatimonadales bacterium]|nr:ABC-F family ATP-binding cassette domain-containing protein [Gemmatimonadales bacterium]
MSQIAISGVAVEYGGVPLLADVTVSVERGDRWGIVGRNGTGKTTLFRLVTGAQAPTRGIVVREPGLRVSLLDQHRDFAGATTVWEAAAGRHTALLALERSLGEQAEAMAVAGADVTEAMLTRYSDDLERFEREGGYTLAPRIDAVLAGLGFDPDEARRRPLDGLSGGERGRLGLVQQLVDPADVLMLDEPTNHLDLETTQWLENYLRSLDATILLVSHDRAFLDAVVDHVLHIEGGTAQTYACGYADFVAQRAERRLSQQRAFDKQQKVIAAEEDFIRRNIAGGNSRQAKGRRRRLTRLPRLSAPTAEDTSVMALDLRPAERGGDQVIVAEGVGVGVPGRTLLEDFSTRVLRGETVGLVGPNGAGKSTLLRTILGERAPEAGTVRVGDSIRVAYYRQDLAQVPADATLYDVIADLRPMWTRGQVQGHLGRFGFSGDSVLRRTQHLSGGEKARVALAVMMLAGANLLVLDEPTNHLDVETIEALEDALEEFDGTVLLVSHDRALLRNLVTRTWVLHERHITDFPGSFEEWETLSEERKHAAAVEAAEREALRRVKEQKQTRRAEDGRKEQQQATRSARRRLEAAEAAVATAEARVGELTRALEDPALYTASDGAERAHRLGAELDAARTTLDRALEEWTAAGDALERLETEQASRG